MTNKKGQPVEPNSDPKPSVQIFTDKNYLITIRHPNRPRMKPAVPDRHDARHSPEGNRHEQQLWTLAIYKHARAERSINENENAIR